MSFESPSSRRPLWLVALGPALAAVCLVVRPGDDPAVARMAAIAAWMAAWWLTEAVPMAVTGLLPLVLVPLADVATLDAVAVNYARPTIFLFLGGFLIAVGLETSGAHRRVALAVVHRVGSRPRRLVLGFMVSTWALSMWISNTSTTLLMLPIVLSVLHTARDKGAEPALLAKLGLASMLGLAYSANMGGMATLVGTPPNLAFQRIFHDLHPELPPVSFLQWSLFALPFSIAFLGCGWLLLTRVLVKLPDVELLGGRGAVAELRAELGVVRRDELVGFAVFGATALLWMTGAGFDFGELHVPGWREALGLQGRVDDAMVAVAMATLLFVVPSRDRPGERMLEWSATEVVPWGVLLLFGGGFALADGFRDSGLSAWAATRFEVLSGAHPWVVVLAVTTLITFLTELTSNIATAQMALPILSSAAATLGIDPRALMVPATLAASCAFMMPVATPPNAIVYGTGLVTMRQMARTGFLFNLVGIALTLATLALLGGPVLGIDVGG